MPPKNPKRRNSKSNATQIHAVFTRVNGPVNDWLVGLGKTYQMPVSEIARRIVEDARAAAWDPAASMAKRAAAGEVR